MKTHKYLDDKLENLFVNSVVDPFSKIIRCRERGVLCNSENENP